MNAVGRIFIGLICVMSIIFMSFTVAVYSTSNNWKKIADAQKVDLDKSKAEANSLKSRMTELEKESNALLEAKGNEIAALRTEKDRLEQAEQGWEFKLSELQKDNNAAIQTIKETHSRLGSAQAQQRKLHTDLEKAQQDWITLLSDFVKKTDEAHALAMKLNNLESVSKELAKQFNNAKTVLNQFNLKPIPELYVGVPPFEVAGRITEVRVPDLVLITIGEDSGLMKGHQLDVYRKNEDGRDTYLGVVEVLLTEPNQAACKILPEYHKGTVKVDDIVTSAFSQERQKFQLKKDTHVATTSN